MFLRLYCPFWLDTFLYFFSYMVSGQDKQDKKYLDIPYPFCRSEKYLVINGCLTVKLFALGMVVAVDYLWMENSSQWPWSEAWFGRVGDS